MNRPPTDFDPSGLFWRAGSDYFYSIPDSVIGGFYDKFFKNFKNEGDPWAKYLGRFFDVRVKYDPDIQRAEERIKNSYRKWLEGLLSVLSSFDEDGSPSGYHTFRLQTVPLSDEEKAERLKLVLDNFRKAVPEEVWSDPDFMGRVEQHLDAMLDYLFRLRNYYSLEHARVVALNDLVNKNKPVEERALHPLDEKRYALSAMLRDVSEKLADLIGFSYTVINLNRARPNNFALLLRDKEGKLPPSLYSAWYDILFSPGKFSEEDESARSRFLGTLNNQALRHLAEFLDRNYKGVGKPSQIGGALIDNLGLDRLVPPTQEQIQKAPAQAISHFLLRDALQREWMPENWSPWRELEYEFSYLNPKVVGKENPFPTPSHLNEALNQAYMDILTGRAKTWDEAYRRHGFGPFIDYYLDQVKKNPGKFHPNFGVGR